MKCFYIVDRATMFWEDSEGLLYYFDKEKRNGADKKTIRDACPVNMHVYATGIRDSGELPEVTDIAVEFGMELNNNIYHQLICVEDNGTYSVQEFDRKLYFLRNLTLCYFINTLRMSPELG